MTLKGFTFGDKHTLNDLGLYLLSGYPEVDFPEVKTEYVDIPGGNGSIDLSEVLTGYPSYYDREIKWKFVYIGKPETWPGKYSEIAGALHGKKMKIVFDEDPNHYYIGRVSLEEFEREISSCNVTIKAKCEPYKYNRLSSVDDWEWDDFNFETDYIQEFKDIEVNGTKIILIHSDSMPINPIFECSTNNITLNINGIEYDMSQGENQIAGLLMVGDTTVRMYGSGTVSIKFRGGMI